MKQKRTLRWHILTSLIRRFGLKACAEIGVKAGRNIERILSRCPEDVTFLAVDPWVTSDGYAHWSENQVRHNERQFDALVSRYLDRITKMKMDSAGAAQKVPDASLDLVFIDGDHRYEFVKQDIALWLPKLRRGGVMAGHDYANTNKYGDRFEGVDRAVHEAFGEDFHTAEDHCWWRRV